MRTIIFLLIASLMFNFACKKDNDEKPKTPAPTNDIVVAATDNSISNNMFDDVFKQGTSGTKKMDDSLGGKSSNVDLSSSCAVITITPFDLVTWPKTVTVDFGNTNCLCNDGYYRRGKLIMTITKWFRDSGCVVTIVPNNYYVNDHKIEGQKVITNLGRNNQQHLKYSVVVSNGKVTDPNGTTFRTWNSSRIHEWISGENTINPWDDEYLISGTADGVTRTNKPYSILINSPLNVYTGCRWIRSGELTLTVQGNLPVKVNYGTNPVCDNIAIVTINGVDYQINM